MVLVLGVGVAGLASLALRPPASSLASWTPAPITPTPTPTYDPQLTLRDVLPRLDDNTREFTILIFGDSTGVSATGWQVLVPKWLGTQYDRSVLLHPWNRDAGAYAQAWGLSSGDNAQITVWNGSSPGRDVAYAREHEGDIAPIDPASVDIVFMNFGHTQTQASLPAVGKFMTEAAQKYSNAAVVYLKQNPDHSTSPLKDIQKDNVTSMEMWATKHKFESIPIYDAIVKTNRVDELMDVPTMIHPNTDGYRIWADVMIQRLVDSGARVSQAAEG